MGWVKEIQVGIQSSPKWRGTKVEDLDKVDFYLMCIEYLVENKEMDLAWTLAKEINNELLNRTLH